MRYLSGSYSIHQIRSEASPPDMNYWYRMLLNYWVEPVVLRESIRARVKTAPVTVIIAILGFCVCLPFLLALGAPYRPILLLGTTLLVLGAARAVLSKSIRHRLDAFSTLELLGADRLLRVSSILTQATVGSWIWIISSSTDHHVELAIFITLLMVCWSVGVLANLFSDLPSFLVSIPIMFSATAAYWIWYGSFGIAIGVCLLLAMALMIMLVRQGSEIFRDSVLMRLQKDQLLQTIQEENLKTQQALREAQLANQSRSYFMAAAAHDVKQPLHALALLTDTLLMSDPPKSTLRLLQQQRSSIDQMADYFDALMDMRSFLKGDYEQHLTRFRLANLGAHLETEFAPLCAGKGLNWSLEFDDLMVLSDYQLLLRLFRNLLSNAVRYTNHGDVRCSAKACGDVVEFLVSDTGIGIDAQYQELVFEDFVRLKIEGLDASGSGLGLSIVKKMSKALGLNLQMSSAPGKGTCFSFRLPIAYE
jgi:two-component system, sensor histidine kinase